MLEAITKGFLRFLRGFAVQHKVLKALFVRDLMVRYGREQLGFVWVILEPMLLTAGVLILWSIIKGGYEHGLRLVELVLTGYLLLTLWRHLTNSMSLLFRRNSALLFHRQVTLFDIYFSRVLLEFIATTTAALVVLAALNLVGAVGDIYDWTKVIGGWLLMAVLGAGAGGCMIWLTETTETAEKFIQPVQYLFVPLSGTFFMVTWLPKSLQQIILLNPMVHTYELLRAGFFGPSVDTHYSIAYVLMWAAVLVVAGLIGIKRLRQTLQVT